MRFHTDRITSLLTTQKFGRMIEFHETIGSTNTYMKGLNLDDYPEGFTVISHEQTAGRGRFERVFHSPAGQGVYMSVLLKPNLAPSDAAVITTCAASAVCKAVDKICGIKAEIKPVNDVYAGRKKLCGILCETVIPAETVTTLGIPENSGKSRKVDFIIVGIGVNIGTVAPEVSDIAVSVTELNKGLGCIRELRNSLTAEVLNQFERIYFDFIRDKKEV